MLLPAPSPRSVVSVCHNSHKEILTNSVFSLSCYTVIYISDYTGPNKSSKKYMIGWAFVFCLSFCCLLVGSKGFLYLAFQQTSILSAVSARPGCASAVLGPRYQAKNNIRTI